MIGSFLSYTDIAVGLDVFKTIVGYFKYPTKTMMSSGFYNTLRVYYFSFSLNFLYWSLASLCSDVVPKTAPKSSTSPLKFLINDVYAGQLKPPPLLQSPWWTSRTILPPHPRPHLPLLEFYSLVSEARVIVAPLLSLSLLPAAGEVVSVFRVIVFYSFLLFSFWILLNLHSYPRSMWDITPRFF